MDNELRSTRDRKGWLLPYLIALDDMFYKRWHYWSEICLNNKIPKDPIPNIQFQAPHVYTKQQVQKNVKACLDYPRELSNPLEAFIDWLLWGFNTGDTFPAISPETDNYWYRTFNMGLFYLEPADHWSTFASDYLGKNNRLGYFGTPGTVVDLMVRMNFGSEPKHEHKQAAVAYLASLYGLNVAKAGFVCQLAYGLSGCLDTINVQRLGLRPRAFANFSQLKTPQGRQRRATHYNAVVREAGGTETLWNAWCASVSERYPAQFPTPNHVSALHLECLGIT